MEFAFQTNGTWAQVRAGAEWAQARGVRALALPDHYFFGPGIPVHDSLTQIGALAAVTDDIDLVSLASPVTFRHPAVLSKIAATIDGIAPGRFVLGIGTGWHQPEHDVFGLEFGTFSERYEKLDEQLAYVAAALSGNASGFDGAHYQLQAEDIQPAAPDVRLLVGGIGPKRTPTMAGRHAHEYNAYPGDDIADRIAVMRAAAAEVGRDPDDILVSSAGAVLVAEDRASYDELFAEMAAGAGRTVDELEEHFAHRRTPRGTVDQVMSTLSELEATGVERFYVQGLGPFDEDNENRTWGLMGV